MQDRAYDMDGSLATWEGLKGLNFSPVAMLKEGVIDDCNREGFPRVCGGRRRTGARVL